MTKTIIMNWAHLKNEYISSHLSSKVKFPQVRLNALKRKEENIKKNFPDLIDPEKLKEAEKFQFKSKLTRHKKNEKLNGAEDSVINGLYKILQSGNL